jgi:hypothetical protein
MCQSFHPRSIAEMLAKRQLLCFTIDDTCCLHIACRLGGAVGARAACGHQVELQKGD